MSNKLKNKNKIDWNIHAVYNPDDPSEPVDIHTHGLEKHNVMNICMKCPSRDEDMIHYCGNFINNLALSMINGEKYRTGITHMCDNADNWDEVYDVFDLDVETRDNGNGEENVYVVDYWFDDIYFNTGNMMHYIFDHDKRKWRVFTIEEFNAMPKDVYDRKIKRNLP